jgi:ABC-type Mn2+/Zn2+ transport system ATPase subunit
LKAGRILGFLGPNGAGKTTSIRILTTMMEPDLGRFLVAGISSRPVAQLIAIPYVEDWPPQRTVCCLLSWAFLCCSWLAQLFYIGFAASKLTKADQNEVRLRWNNFSYCLAAPRFS